MRLYRETTLREQADEPIVAMLELWRSLSEQKIGAPIEVMIGNRREHRQLSLFSGELNTAFPVIVKGKVVLSLWLDSLSDVNPILVTHEIGHWVLKLQDFRGLIYQPQLHSDVEIYLNSLAHHPPLYALQRSLGHDPQLEIDSRTLHDIEVFSHDRETKDRQFWVKNALLFTDDLMNCSEEYYTQLDKIVSKKHPNTSNLLKKILAFASSYNLLSPDQNLKFSRRVIQDLKLGSGWREMDEVRTVISMLDQAQRMKTADNCE
ncbi:MAG: hypothetical protein KAT65_08460 [Methanophagales archaeon]|nr:hypothetical protein [Methanophagales archaeon]